MKKIAFYLNNPSLAGNDFSSIMNGNPGIGGSEYEFLLVPYLLEKRNNGIEPYLIANCDAIFQHKNVVIVKNLDECCDTCVKLGIGVVVIDIKHFDKEILDKYKDRLNVVIWAHNNASYKQLDQFMELDYVKRIVNCGREEMELYRDHPATLKSTYIYNIFPFKNKDFYYAKAVINRGHNVVYMGSIVKVKGFHVLARAWTDILKELPDAQLFVIGSGNLYNKTAVMGKYGIAEDSYEREFMPYLTDGNGQILPSVHFMGLLGEEKFDVMGKCKVGVPNPTGKSECLPITVIEMQLLGCGITTILHPAYLDTVMNKQYLYKKETDLAKYVVNRLKADQDDHAILYDYVVNKFGVNGNIERWENLINNIDTNIVEPISEYGYQHKKLKNALFGLKMKYKVAKLIPCIERFYFLQRKIKKHLYCNNP